MILNFPAGAGGNWLIKVLLNQPLRENTKNFHYDYFIDPRLSGLKDHNINPLEFDYLYSGSYFFNFYMNVMYKHFYLESSHFKNANYNGKFLECVNTARHICKFNTINHLIFFNFDNLLFAPDTFLSQINYLQKKLDLQQTSNIDFAQQRTLFFNTCVSTTDVYENFDNMYWVCFVIGELMNYNCVPTNFLISSYENQDKCKEFAQANYKQCKLTKVHQFNTNVYLPNLQGKT
jgi:hypothetical protein